MEVTLFNDKIISFNTINEFYDYEDFDKIKICRIRTIKIEEFIKLPKDLEILHCDKNQLKILDNLPENLEKLYCFNNQLKTLDNLPKDLKYLYCENKRYSKFN